MRKHNNINFRILAALTLSLTASSCATKTDYEGIDFRGEMRNFITGISSYARTQDKNCNPGFIVITQNGQNVAWDREWDEAVLSGKDHIPCHQEFFSSINGTGREDTFYGGAKKDYTPTPKDDSLHFTTFCDMYRAATGADGKKLTVLSVDYCKEKDAEDSLNRNLEKGYVSTQQTSRILDVIPPVPVHDENDRDILQLSDCSNFLYLLNPNPTDFPTKEEFIRKVGETNYDALIIDLCDIDGNMLTQKDVESLKTKANGSRRLVICYMSIGEAEDYRWYWSSIRKKRWILRENPAWQGNFPVEYWNSEWQSVIYGSENSYVGKILDRNFDGVYLDIVDGFENFE